MIFLETLMIQQRLKDDSFDLFSTKSRPHFCSPFQELFDAREINKRGENSSSVKLSNSLYAFHFTIVMISVFRTV